MTAFLSWYFLTTLLGWLTFPIAYSLFPALADRGYSLARAAGLLLWGYVFWLLASIGIAQNDIGGILLAAALLAALSFWLLGSRRAEIVEFLRSHLFVVIVTEFLFLAAFGFMAFVRSANPELTSTEKPMELAFINGILRSPTFPPHDPWLSGYAISYYYFGYVMTAMLAKLSGIPGSMAHNLMTALVFGLGAVGSYGILFTLLARTGNDGRRPSVFSALFAPLFLLLVSNFEALLEVLHRRGLFWGRDASGALVSSFWTWLDMKELSQPPIEPFQWVPDRYLWWWRASRVIQDYDMTGGFREVIDEFPFFSFLLGDLHPHVLAIPFSLLAVAVALNLYLGGFRGVLDIFGNRLHVHLPGFLFFALVIGGLAFLNTWDILVGATLIVAAYVLLRADEDGWRWNRIEDLLLFALPLGLVSILLYFPFYLGFSSQAGGILPNFMYVTRGAHLWVMWGTLFIPIFAYLLHLRRVHGSEFQWRLGASLSLGFVLVLYLLTLSLGWAGSLVEPDFVQNFLASQGLTAAQYIGETALRRLEYFGSLVTLLALLLPSLAYLFSRLQNPQESESTPRAVHRYVILLIAVGTILVIAPEFVYLRDQFGYRINTVFKFYYQAWILLSLAAAFGVSVLVQRLSGLSSILFRLLTALVIFAGLLYPALGLLNKTNDFKPVDGFTLDDFDRIRRENPDEAAAIEFLRTVPNGVLLESVGDGYSGYARISTHTGLQTVLGWPGHEAQWRGTYEPQGSRREDVTKLYTTSYWEEAQQIIDEYDIRYIFIGSLERRSLSVSEEKFKAFLKPVFQQGETVIYEVP